MSVDEDDKKSNAAKPKTTKTLNANGEEEEEDFGDDPEAGKREKFVKSATNSASRRGHSGRLRHEMGTRTTNRRPSHSTRSIQQRPARHGPSNASW